MLLQPALPHRRNVDELLNDIRSLDNEVLLMLRRAYDLKRVVDKRIADSISKK